MKVAIAGATGLTGNFCLKKLLQHPQVTQVISIGRRASGVQDSKLNEVILQDGKLPNAVPADAFICTLGTTIKKAGSKEAFKKIDFELPVYPATELHRSGCETAALLSAYGASPSSIVFYSKTKGETEAAFKSIGFKSLSLLRPSLITGERNEKRAGENFSIGLLRVLSPLLVGGLSVYRPIDAERIAQKLVSCVVENKSGEHIVTYKEIVSG